VNSEASNTVRNTTQQTRTHTRCLQQWKWTITRRRMKTGKMDLQITKH